MEIKIKTSFYNAVLLNLASSVFAGFAITAFFYFAKILHLKESVFFGFSVSLVGVIFSLIRFSVISPRALIISDEQLHIIKRKRKIEIIAWSSVLEAAHSTFLGMKWTLYLCDKKITISDDGFAISDWDILSEAICKHLGMRHKLIKTDLIGKATVKMD